MSPSFLIRDMIRDYFIPSSISEAAKLAATQDVTILAGGTDLMLQFEMGKVTLKDSSLMSLRKLDELRNISEKDGVIEIGALCTISELLNSELLQDVAPVLCDTALCFAGSQIRNTATLGGNICNASPAGDMIIPLLLLDGEITLSTWNGQTIENRMVTIDSFFVAPGKTKLEKRDILNSIRFRIPDNNSIAYFKKFGTRKSMDISVVSVGVSGKWEEGILSDTRVALGAVAPTPIRQREVEAILNEVSGNPFAEILKTILPRIKKTLETKVKPISDVRASAWYRNELLYKLLERILTDVAHKT